MTSLLRRSTEELIVLFFGLICLAGLIPFSVIRFSRGEWALGLVDLFGILTTIVMMTHVYRTRRVKFANHLLATIALSGVSIIVLMNGPLDTYFLYPTVVALYFLVSPNLALMMTFLAVAFVSPSLLVQMDSFQYMKFLVSLIGCVLFAYLFATTRNRQRDKLLWVSSKDALTGAGNRRALDEKLEELIQVYKRNKVDNCLLLIDVDNFKQVNDSKGHAVGDQTLIRVTETIQSRIRITDSLYRFGGDEFVVLVSNADLATSSRLAEDLRSLIDTNENEVSISLGVAQYLEEQTKEEWLRCADEALFAAKREGRNKVVTSESERG